MCRVELGVNYIYSRCVGWVQEYSYPTFLSWSFMCYALRESDRVVQRHYTCTGPISHWVEQVDNSSMKPCTRLHHTGLSRLTTAL